MQEHPTYYDQPVVRSGHWHWQIILYFWIGGIAGASYMIGVIAALLGDKEHEEIGRAGRYVALVGMILSPILLIWDLGKPARFLNMLRRFKMTSPMSIGTWGVTLLGGFVGGSALLQAGKDRGIARAGQWLPIWNRVVESFGALMGLFMAGYTGVLISTTAVPLWARNYKTNAATFLGSALANGAAMLSLVLTLNGRGNRQSEVRLSRIQLGATLTETLLLIYELRHLGSRLRRPWTRGRTAKFFYGSVLSGLVFPTLLGTPRSAWLKIAKATSTLLGGLLFRTAIIEGGHESAEDPQAYHMFNEIE
jgi:formate-dependent nitrite reductase membrane component NrfD